MSNDITLPREVVEKALEAMEGIRPFMGGVSKKLDAAIPALRAALAEPTDKDSLTVQVDALRGQVAHLLDQLRLANIDCGISETENESLCREIDALQTENEWLQLAVDAAEALYDGAWCAGAKAGWNFCADGDKRGFHAAISSRDYLKELGRIRQVKAALRRGEKT